MISTMTLTPAAVPTSAAAFPAATAAPQVAVMAAPRLRAQETSALRQVLGGTAHVFATGLTAGAVAGSGDVRSAVVIGTGNAPVQGLPSRGTPV